MNCAKLLCRLPRTRFRRLSTAAGRPVLTRKVREKISVYLKSLAQPDFERDLGPLRAAAKEAGERVRRLKADDADETTVRQAVQELKLHKQRLEAREAELVPPDAFLNQDQLAQLLARRFFFDRSFAGVAGLVDLGPLGCALKRNLLSLWRSHFVLGQDVLEVECPVLTPAEVLRASGHTERFCDFVLRDALTGEEHRADHLVRDTLEARLQTGGLSAVEREAAEEALRRLPDADVAQLDRMVREFRIRAPLTDNELSPTSLTNLMFPTTLGGSGGTPAFLRPETAQGIFLNFRRLLDFNSLPLAVAQVGQAFRNEISPKPGLLRLREFTVAELEHFAEDTALHADFGSVQAARLSLWSAESQAEGRGAEQVSVGDAVRAGVISGQTMAFYMAKAQAFFRSAGLDPSRLRFRQHKPNEMAHYARDCWDAECHTSQGWVECAGFADRGSFDLRALSAGLRLNLGLEPGADGQPRFPQVVEPSFGIGRVMQAVLEHSFREREQKRGRHFFAFPFHLAPIQCGIYPIVRDSKFELFTVRLRGQLRRQGISCSTFAGRDTLGRRYVRGDEMGIPLAITVDDSTVLDGTVTIRDVVTTRQVTVKMDDVGRAMTDLLEGQSPFSRVNDGEKEIVAE